jgi:signal transduction histidine kinase
MTDKEIILELQDEIYRLSQQVKLLNNQTTIKDKIVIKQSKMASMGEMINNIAHQWRQPLMEISSLLMTIEVKIKTKSVISHEDILETIKSSNYILKFMSNTIDDFRNFFATDKQKNEFLIVEQISSALNIMKSSLLKNNIKVEVIIKKNIMLFGFANEYTQVLINIISNAQDIMISNNIQNKKIIIRVYQKENKSILEIEDNAGGIKITPITKVFEPFFTHNKNNGSGVGLFMSKLIIEDNMHGTLTVENKQHGACFRISI